MKVIKKQGVRDFFLLDTWSKLSRGEKIGYLVGTAIGTAAVLIVQHLQNRQMYDLIVDLEQAENVTELTTEQLRDTEQMLDQVSDELAALRRLDESNEPVEPESIEDLRKRVYAERERG